MTVMTDNQKKVILANNSTCIGVLLVCYRVLVILYIIATIAPNFAVQRDPVVGADPTVSRFSALPHVIWMIIPIVVLAYAERARLLSMFADRQAAKYLQRRLWWMVFIFMPIDIVAAGIHFAGFLVEGIIQTSPLYNNPNTQALVWTGVGFTVFQFLWSIWILVKFIVFRDNLRVSLAQGLPFTNSSIEDGISQKKSQQSSTKDDFSIAKNIEAAIENVGIGNVFNTKKKRSH